MKVFPDTNVLVAALTTRGFCADVLRVVITQHEMLVGEVVLEELARVLRRLKVPGELIEENIAWLRGYAVVPRPAEVTCMKLRDASDEWVLTSAVSAGADVLVTGDRDLLDVADRAPLRILDPRAFWKLARTGEQ